MKNTDDLLEAFDEWREEDFVAKEMIKEAKNKKVEKATSVGAVNSFNLYHKVYNENILLMYKGAITFDLVTSIIETLGRKISVIETNRKTQKLFYNVAVECVHNLYHHMDEVKGTFKEVSKHDAKAGLITVIAKEKYYNIITGNFMPTKHIYSLKEKIDEVNNTDHRGLKLLYRETLSNGEFSDKGTAGLGLIQLARKTSEKLRYKFEKVNGEYTYFTFQIKIDR